MIIKRKMTVTVNDKEYPCYLTMGAYMYLEQETGKSVAQCTTLSDQCVFIWACCKAACEREGIDFPFSVQQFANNLTPEDLIAASETLQEPSPGKGDAEKKA